MQRISRSIVFLVRPVHIELSAVANDNMTGHIAGTLPPAAPLLQSPHLHLIIPQDLAQHSTTELLRLPRI